MTLTEYMNQTVPVRMPDVVLEEHECRIGHKVHDRRAVYINHEQLPGEYAIKQGDTGRRLWTTDGDGNPVRRSCFRIQQN